MSLKILQLKIITRYINHIILYRIINIIPFLFFYYLRDFIQKISIELYLSIINNRSNNM